ncbi:MAG: carbohydrate ABC transporter permease [Spirochaetaceae bacterium]|jgi:raffinose/stachyose/melibiose transport system permease protein|nr:carbohydrate ABC transporter permease [Spirochaetaceae bacterium]
MKKHKTVSPWWTVTFCFAILWLLITGLPFYYLVITSFKSIGDFLSGGLFKMTVVWEVSNYVKVLQGGFSYYFASSLTVVLASRAPPLFLSTFAAYPLFQMTFKLNKPVYSLIVAAMSVPIYITLTLVFVMAIRTGFYDTLWAMVGPNIAFNLPMSVVILVSFMRGIPRELEEAAKIDGCGKFATFFRIIFPPSKSGLVTLGIYNGVVIWNEFIFVMVLIQSQSVRTMPLAVWQFQGQYSSSIPVIVAVLTLSSLPIISLYIFGQDKLVKGMMAGAVKGLDLTPTGRHKDKREL